MKEHIVIHFERSGGFAGMSRAVNIDSQELPQIEADQLFLILEKIDFSNVGKNLASTSTVPDGFGYHLTIAKGSGKQELTFGDGRIPLEIQPLFEYLNRKLRTAR